MKSPNRRQPIQEGLFGPINDHRFFTSEQVTQVDARSAETIASVAFESGGDRVYDYAVPQDWDEGGSLRPGMRVLAPFGRGNRKKVGFCLSVRHGVVPADQVGTEDNDARPTRRRLKQLIERVDDQPLLDEAMLSLARWLSSYYLCPMGMVLAAMVPAAVRNKAGRIQRAYLSLTDRGRETLKRTNPTGQTRDSDDSPGSSTRPSEPTGRPPESTGDSESGGESLGRLGPRGKEIVKRLWGQERPWVPLDQLQAELTCTRAPFLTLQRNGWVTIRQCQEWREDDSSSIPDLPGEEPRADDAEAAEMSEVSEPSVTTEAEGGGEARQLPGPACRLVLNDDQQVALAACVERIDQGGFHPLLLYGVTGSGKTEIYIRCIERVLHEQNRQAVVLVPEIALTPQTLRRFRSRFHRVAVLHSGLTPVQRHGQWRRIAAGEADVVIGARSAVFAPVPNPGLFIVDEEHESSYKQDTQPRYHGRDIAIKRAQLAQVPVMLGSATPSLESWCNATVRNQYQLLSLPERVLKLPLPRVQLVDMKEEMANRRADFLFSQRLVTVLRQTLDRGRQAILLLNRRGHSSYVFCPSCRYVQSCPNCDVSLTCHQQPGSGGRVPRQWVMCHHCLHATQLLKRCPVCGRNMTMLGPGTQHAQERLAGILPQARIRRVDSDSMKPTDYAQVLDQFGRGDIDILLGTQMVGKGLDYPNVAMVGVLSADTALSIPDFRSAERTFQLIAQVAGRCGRMQDDGVVVVQSFNAADPTIQYACQHDFQRFARQEMAMRQRCELPPFARMARLLLSDPDIEKVETEAANASRRLAGLLRDAGFTITARGIGGAQAAQTTPAAVDHGIATSSADPPAQPEPSASARLVHLNGPGPAPLARLENRFRFQLILRAADARQLQRALKVIRESLLPGLRVRAVVDVDPINLL